MRIFLIAGLLSLLTACSSFQLTAMSRDTGKAYTGSAEQTGSGRGIVTINIDGKIYTGPYARTSSQEATSFASTFTRTGAFALGTGSTSGANTTSMALLSAPDGSGMRCAFQAVITTGTGGGLCVENTGVQYDVVFSTK